MRVLLFRWLCDSGGVSTSMLLLGRELERRGIECEYWFCKPSNRLEEFRQAGPTTLGPLSQLAPRLARGDFDVVQMTCSDPAAQLLAIMARPARVIVTNRGALSDLWNRNACFAFTAVSEAMAVANQPLTDLQIEAIPNAVDLDRFHPPLVRKTGSPILAFVGRTKAGEKDFPRFTRIASHLVGQGARIWVADPHESSWDDFAGLPVVEVPVERWSRVSFEEMPGFYRDVAESGGAVLVTSRTEGFGNVAVEAAASGAMTVAPALLGLRESVIDGRTGRFFPPDATDAEAAECVAECLATQPSPGECAAAASIFSSTALGDAYAALYRRPSQRLASGTAAPADDPGMELLLTHLRRQAGWRADACISSAAPLAGRGYPWLALVALSIALRASPRRLLRWRAVRQVISALGWVGRRPDRLYRQWARRHAEFAVPPTVS